MFFTVSVTQNNSFLFSDYMMLSCIYTCIHYIMYLWFYPDEICIVYCIQIDRSEHNQKHTQQYVYINTYMELMDGYQNHACIIPIQIN